jgi:integrase
MRYRYDGKTKRLDIGSYPLVSLKAARIETIRLRAELEQGHDPKIVRQLEKQAIIEADSIKELFMQWYESYCVINKKGHHEVLRSFELYVFPKVGHLPAEKVTMHEWLALLENLSSSVPGITERILTNAKQMLKWAVKRRLVTSNPIADINASEDLHIKNGVGTRSLSDEEICLVWRAITKSRMAHKNKLFVKLCLVFGCRNGELRLSEKAHFDLDNNIWTIPPENHKLGKMTNKPLLRPIIPEVKELIREALLLSETGKHLFNNSGTNSPMGRSAPLALPYNTMQWLRRHEGYNMEHWSLHDLRKTARTNLSELTEPHVAEIMLGHKLPGSWQVYDHYDYIKEQAVAYSKWWDKIVDVTKAV